MVVFVFGMYELFVYCVNDMFFKDYGGMDYVLFELFVNKECF